MARIRLDKNSKIEKIPYFKRDAFMDWLMVNHPVAYEDTMANSAQFWGESEYLVIGENNK